MNSRRDFMRLLGGAAVAWPAVADGQAERMRRIGVLVGLAENDPEGKARLARFSNRHADRQCLAIGCPKFNDIGAVSLRP
jgi:hypothetical protein